MISLKKVSCALALGVLALSACDDEAVGPTPNATTLTVVGPTTMSTLAYTPTVTPVQVRLTAANGGYIVGEYVHFAVTSSGTGVASLSADSAVTDANGIASVGVTAGAVGSYTVTASADDVAPVTVSVTAVAPASDLIAVYSGNGQSGLAAEPLAPFQVIVLREDGTPAGAGVPVNFQVTGGSGSLSSTATTTNANGIATSTLTLGTSGTQTVAVTSPGLLGTTFTAQIADPCSAARQATTPGTFTRSLDAADCHNAENRYVEYFSTTVTATPLQFTQSSTAFTPSFSIRAVGGADTIGFHTPGATPATFMAFLKAGTYWLAPSSSAANATGSYTVTSTTIAGTDITGCERVYLTRGVNTGNQNIDPTDCQLTYDDAGGNGAQLHYGDRYRIYLKAGESITITMEGAADHLIRVLNPNTGAAVLQYDNGVKGTTETTTFTAPSAGQWIIDAATYNNNAGGTPPDTGPYKLTIGA